MSTMINRMRRLSITRLLGRLLLPNGSVRRISLGPMAGLVYRVGAITGWSAWYSGPERDHQNIFRRLIKPGNVVVDIGANWGLHSLYLSRLVGKMGRVIAIECFPPALAELRWHLGANRCKNVTVVPTALADREGHAFFVPGESAYTGRLAESSKVAQKNAIEVPVRTLDGLLESLQLPVPTMVKIDVEGSESRVLEGAERMTRMCHPLFIIDLHTPDQDVKVAKWLTERGYHLRRLSGPPIYRTDVGWPNEAGVWGSILGLPPRGH